MAWSAFSLVLELREARTSLVRF